MDREPISQQPEVNIIQSNREGLALRERESHFNEAGYIIDTVYLKTIETRHQDEMFVVLSRAGIETIKQDLDHLEKDDPGFKEAVLPNIDNVTEISENIRLLEELGKKFGYNQSSEAANLKDMLTRIRLSRNEEETEKLVHEAKNIFYNNVTRLLNKHDEIASQQEDTTEQSTENSRKLEKSLDRNFKGEIRKLEKSPVGFYIKRSVKYAKDESKLFEDSLYTHNNYRDTLMSSLDRFTQVMDSFVASDNNNSES